MYAALKNVFIYLSETIRSSIIVKPTPDKKKANKNEKWIIFAWTAINHKNKFFRDFLAGLSLGSSALDPFPVKDDPNKRWTRNYRKLKI